MQVLVHPPDPQFPTIPSIRCQGRRAHAVISPLQYLIPNFQLFLLPWSKHIISTYSWSPVPIQLYLLPWSIKEHTPWHFHTSVHALDPQFPTITSTLVKPGIYPWPLQYMPLIRVANYIYLLATLVEEHTLRDFRTSVHALDSKFPEHNTLWDFPTSVHALNFPWSQFLVSYTSYLGQG